MFRYEGQFTYTTARSHRQGDLARIALEISIFGPRFPISIHDARYDSIHSLMNTRFDFKSRDSHIDLLARDSWYSDWVDCFRDTARLVYPRLDSAPATIRMLIYASWDPSFAVVEFQIGEDFCQFATRCRPGSAGRWVRSFPKTNQPPPKMADKKDETQKRTESVVESTCGDSPAHQFTMEAASSASTDAFPPSEPIHVNFDRIQHRHK